MLSDFKEEINPQSQLNLHYIRDKLLAAPIIAADIETTGLDFANDDLTIISFATPEEGWAIELKFFSLDTIKEIFAPVIDDPDKICVWYNASFDLRFLAKYNIFPKNRLADVMIMVWLWDEDPFRYGNGVKKGAYRLKRVAQKELNKTMVTYDEATSLLAEMDDYAADDAVKTLELYFLFKKRLIDLSPALFKWFEETEMPITQLLIETELRGVRIDNAGLKHLRLKTFDELDVLESRIYKEAGYEFKITSSQDMAKMLFGDLKIGVKKDGTNKYTERSELSGEWKTGVEILKRIREAGYPIASLILEYRELNKRLTSFMNPLIERTRFDDIIHPRYSQIGTKSGRFASYDPNYQQLPRKGGIRNAFQARPGYKIVRIDYSQAELRLMAHMSQDPTMLDIYRNGGDIHQITADACRIDRQAAKAVNFGLIYRMSPGTLKSQLFQQGIIVSMEEAIQYCKSYFKKYTRVKKYHQRVHDVIMTRLFAEGVGYVKTLGGRYRRLDSELLRDEQKSYTTITQGINTTIQGGVSDLIKWAMVKIQNEFRLRGWLDPRNGIWDACIQGQVHDEVFSEVLAEYAEEAAALKEKIMVEAGVVFGISVPMNADPVIVDDLAKG